MISNVEPGGSLLVAWRLNGRRVLIVGGGEVASQRLVSVLSADALVTLIAPRNGLHPGVAELLATSPHLTYHDRVFGGPDDLTGVDMVLIAIDDVVTSREICSLCRTLRIPVNVADVPPSCDFYFGSQVRRGPLQVMISTNGNGPKLANLVKRRIEAALPENVGVAVEKVGTLRKRLRQRAPGVGGDLSKRRMKWMSSVCEAWSLDDLALLDEDAMERLLDEGWEHDIIPSPHGVLRHHPWLLFRHISGLGSSFTAGLIAGAVATSAVMLIRRRGAG